MDNEQAKLILSAYRPSGEDANDPLFAEALEQVRRDPELGAWFADQRQFDQSIQTSLWKIVPPSGLRENLLINQDIQRFDQPSRRQNRLLRPSVLALAASVVLLLGLGFLWRPFSPAPLTTAILVKEAFQLEQSDLITHGKTGGGNDAFRAWLAQRGSPSDFTLPAGLESIDGIGCQTLSIKGHKVSLICFTIDEERDLVVHFFATASSGLSNPPGSAPTFIHYKGLTAATWSCGTNTYVLFGRDVDEETLRRLI